jgi:hypothetical protein
MLINLFIYAFLLESFFNLIIVLREKMRNVAGLHKKEQLIKQNRGL